MDSWDFFCDTDYNFFQKFLITDYIAVSARFYEMSRKTRLQAERSSEENEP